MKMVAVFFDKPGYNDYPFNEEEYVTAYHELGSILHERGATFAIVRGQDSYKGNNTFTHSWVFDGKTFKEENEEVVVDMIYNKGHFKADSAAKLLNDRELDRICTDKFATYQMFPSLFPQTLLVKNTRDLQKALKQISSDLVVAKPLDAEGGKGVIIDKPDVVLAKVQVFPYVIQQFIDSSAGIKHIVESHHDLRMIVIDGDIVLSYIRTPPEGSLRANVSKGGKEVEVPLEHVPHEALAIKKVVDEEFKRFNRRVYSIDCARHVTGDYLVIELNSKPGLSPARLGKYHKNWLERLSDALLS